MPTLSLYTPTDVADASHAVVAPGGYEWWHFDAEDAAGDLYVVATLYLGFAFDGRYLARYASYRRRPTRVRPPLPGEFPGVRFAVYERGRTAAQFTSRFAAAECEASAERLSVRVGTNCCAREQDGIVLEVEGSTAPGTLAAKAVLKFRPRFEGAVTARPFRAATGGEQPRHWWVVADPLCDVEGEIHLPGRGAVRFSGRGYHDHQYGTRSAPEMGRWMRGRVLLDDAAVALRLSWPAGGVARAEALAVESDRDGVREWRAEDVGWDRAASRGSWPGRLRVGERLSLSKARRVGESPISTWAAYDAECGGRAGRALCEFVRPSGGGRPVWAGGPAAAAVD